MTDIVERIKDAENATHALFNYIFQDAREEIERLRAKITEMEEQEPAGFLDGDGCAILQRELEPSADLYALPGAQPAPSIPTAKNLGDHRSAAYVLGWNECRAEMLGASPGAQPAPSVPDGWKLVPIDPTPEMLRALIDGANQYDSWHEGYRDMLAAAPEAKPCP